MPLFIVIINKIQIFSSPRIVKEVTGVLLSEAEQTLEWFKRLRDQFVTVYDRKKCLHAVAHS